MNKSSIALVLACTLPFAVVYLIDRHREVTRPVHLVAVACNATECETYNHLDGLYVAS